MYEYHKTNETLTHYILTLMSHVALLYKDATIGNPVSMYVKDILILDQVFVERQPNMIGVNSGEMLKSFCLFQNTLKGYQSPYNHDVAILLTRETICRNAATGQCDTLGLAELGTMCSTSSSCAIIKDKGLPTSYTIAHELGHVLNMPHDDDLEKCSRHNENDSGIKYIMGRMIRNDSKPWLWSNCSRRYLTDFLESNRANCLLNKPSLQEVDIKNLPGEDFSGDQQCELIFGKGLKLCTYMPKCQYLWCEIDSDLDTGCQTQHQPWADGTICGPHHWCIRGKCLPQDPTILTPVAGGWGPWKRAGPCSRTCGGGVRTVERDCDNPRPQNGGPYCAGPSVRYESCNIENCEDDSEEFREQQCKRFNGNTMGVPGLTKDVKWVPKYEGILASELCMLYCRVSRTNQHYLLSERVIDGTKCGFNSHDMCVSGRCRRGGCDNRLGSNLALDDCGECGGDNSRCQQVHGQHTHKPPYGYSKVVRIPKGSSNLDIRQHGWERDGNYLALVDSETGHYVMNGDHILHAYPTVFMYAGVTFSYTGTDVSVERINSSNSVRLKKDLLVELLSVDKLLPPNITYSYMIVREKITQYLWQLHPGSWGPCSRACSGSQHAKPLCMQQSTGAIVPEDMCEGLDRDISLMKRECNTHCRLSWRVNHRFPCSAACGPGFRTIVYQCVRINNTLDSIHHHSGHQELIEPNEDTLDVEGDIPWAEPMDEQHCSDLQKPPEMEKCEGSCEEVRWKYDEWSECSRTCGTGIKRRTAVCVSSSTTLDPVHCSTMSPPVTSQPCNTQRCPTWAVLEWTSCNATCGKGWRVRPYYCHIDGRILSTTACDLNTLPKNREECVSNQITCARWDTSQWQPCDCSSNTQIRHLHCISTTNYTSLPQNNCQDLLRPNTTRPCTCPFEPPQNTSPAVVMDYTWRSGPWSECSRSCGAGTKSRNVACVDQTGLVDDSKCDVKEKPINRVQCTGSKCAQWNIGDWSECTPDCNRYRLVICQNDGKTIPSHNCPTNTRPHNKTSCTSYPHCTNNPSTTPIPRYKWKISEWGPCSRSCGKGIRNRQVICIDLNLNATLVDTACVHKKPKTQRVCHKSECTHIWIEGPWTGCTQSCGNGMRYRNVTCHRLLPHRRTINNIVLQTTCDIKTKPHQIEKCNLRNCEQIQYSWAMGPWKTCSHTCGNKGRQIRHIYCQSSGKKVPKKFCPRNSKPQRKQKCNIKKCTPYSYHNCLDVKRGLLTTQDGDYEMNIRGKIIKIYCYKMNEIIPQEYLSLHGDGRENYAETYGKQLLNPDTCPNNGQRIENCSRTQCTDNDSGIAGMTIFYKLKINITSLILTSDDFTFSRQIYGAQIPFGTASDCYSRNECPQGRFAINLQDTGFKIHPSVDWIKTGVSPSISVVKHTYSISGKCGGYCGGCAPNTRVGFMLQTDGG